MEAELFGAEAETYGAASRREGRFEAADGGTLFLDEIGNLGAEGQMKLLRILQAVSTSAWEVPGLDGLMCASSAQPMLILRRDSRADVS
jgi:sigma54-dependent transcription regulator